MGFRSYRWGELASQQAEEHGILRTRVRDMARQSAPFTHPKWNRRFEDWAFRIEGDLVLEFGAVPDERQEVPDIAMWARKCTICRGSLRMTFYEEHEKCNGKGCLQCDDGQVRVERRCASAQRSDKSKEVCSDRL